MLLETDRLLLRELRMTDLDELAEIHADPKVRRSMGPFARPEAIRWMESNQREWVEHRYGRLAIVKRVTGRFLGRSGLKYWRQFDETEVGWVLRPDAWGHGFATEAARACVDWGFRNLSLPYITAMSSRRTSARFASPSGLGRDHRWILGTTRNEQLERSLGAWLAGPR